MFMVGDLVIVRPTCDPSGSLRTIKLDIIYGVDDVDEKKCLIHLEDTPSDEWHSEKLFEIVDE